MAKEIERKWLFNYADYEISNFNEDEYSEIKDYYFNRYCRLRVVDGFWYITIKSEGGLIRDEEEFSIDKSEVDFIPTPMLKKKRIYVTVDKYIYEVNVFKDIYIECDGQMVNLITVELELESPHAVITPPDFCGPEVTEQECYYGYNLFNMLKTQTENSFKPKKKEDNIIYLKDFLDKR